jgi:outer membrane protein assembly factor BamD (BamD/ComL family)
MREELLARALQRATDMEAAGRFSDAAREAESLLAPHRDDPRPSDAARRLIETLEQAKARCEWFNRVRHLLPQEDFASTERSVREIAEQYPDHPQTSALLSAVREERERRERQARREQARAQAKQNLDEKQFDAAIQILSALHREFPSDGSLRTDLQAAEAAQRRAEREESYARGRAEVAELIQRGQHEAAIRRLNALRKEFPADAGIEEDIAAAKAAQAAHERRQAAVRAREKAERLIGNQNFSSAIQILQPLLEQFPEDEAIRQDWQAAVAGDAALRLRAAVAQRLAAHEFDQVRGLLAEARQAASPETDITALEADLLQAELRAQQEYQAQADRLKHGRAEAQQRLKEKQFDAAIRILRDLIRDFPGDPSLNQELLQAEASRDADQRERTWAQAREKAAGMIANGKFDAAIRILGPFRQEFPRDKVLEGLLQKAAAAKERAARPNWLQIYETMAEIETLYAKGKAAKVRDRTRELLAEVEEPRARELLKWAEAAVAREPQESRSALWAGLTGIVDRAASLLGGLGAEQDQLRVGTAEVSFTVPAGAAGVPPPAAVTVTSESAWTVHAAEPWMVVEQQTGGVAITVNSRGLRAGSYSGSLVILTAVGRGRQEVRVKLTVEP